MMYTDMDYLMLEAINNRLVMQEQQDEVQVSGYRITKTLGKGTFGKVRIAVHLATQEKVAVKILEKQLILDPSDVQRISREIKILKKVSHPYIISLYEIVQTQSRLYLFMEYASEGDLFNKICISRRIKQEAAVVYFVQLLQGLKYLHQQGITHRDLKPENLLIDNNVIKIADFGLGNFFENGGQLKTACGSPCYAAPQMIAKLLYDPTKIDVWSSGIVLYVMVVGQLPFEDSNVNNLYSKIKKGEFRIPDYLSLDLKDLLKGILNTDPVSRLSVQQILSHAWVKLHRSLITTTVPIKLDPMLVAAAASDYNLDKQKLLKALTSKKHNALTTTYYLWIKRGNYNLPSLAKANSTPAPNHIQARSFTSLVTKDTANLIQSAQKSLESTSPMKQGQKQLLDQKLSKAQNNSAVNQQNRSFNDTGESVLSKVPDIVLDPTLVESKLVIEPQQITQDSGLLLTKTNPEIIKTLPSWQKPCKQKSTLVQQQIAIQFQVTKKTNVQPTTLRKVGRMPTENMKRTATRLYQRSGSRDTQVSVRLKVAQKNKLVLKRIEKKPRLLNSSLFFQGHVEQLRDFVKIMQPQNCNIAVEYYQVAPNCLYIVKANLDIHNLSQGLTSRFALKH